MIGVATAAIIVLLNGGGVEHYLIDFKKEVKNTVQDKGRKKLILSESKELAKNLKSLSKEINGHFDDLVKVHSDFNSTEDTFDSVLKQLVTDQKEAVSLILDARDKMHEQLTKEEWETIFSSKELK